MVIERWPPVHDVNPERQQLVDLVVERRQHTQVIVKLWPLVHVDTLHIVHGQASTAA